ncbi:hypothetical protein E2C01_036898 [Portunus trituberculatus]|uniref:Uncharacterized protein n=1 Tax=Portunus trituberculatus TaxID=210409 RepID=A0A5B7FD70_PORTR|nr:hypothetical protein [Portunus trituberculatus]
MVGAASSQTRAELVDGHILLPEDAVLVPIFAFPHTQTQVATNSHSLRTPNVPQSHPYNHPHPGSDYPVSPYSTKVASQSLSLVRPSPWASLYAAGGYGSQPVSVNNVRNPQTHLHFPYHYSYTQGGSDVGLGYGLPYYTV